MRDAWTELLERQFGFESFRPGQREIIEAVAAGQDAVAVMPTGSGKSLCYQLPALALQGLTLVVSPLIALMKDQTDQLASRSYPATYINSTVPYAEQQARLAQVGRGAVKLLYVTPERFKSGGFRDSIRAVQVSLFAVDEAHCISTWGHDFRPDYLRLQGAAELVGRPPIVALTATATPQVRDDIARHLGLRSPRVLVAGFDRPNLYLEVFEAATLADKLNRILQAIREAGTPGILYCATRKNVEAVAADLKQARVPALAYHAGMASEDRHRVQEAFMGGRAPVMVATNAFGMGVDKPDIRIVIHYDFPGSMEAYYQEVGRAGRDGKLSQCVLLFNYADRWMQEFFIEGNHPGREAIESVYEFLLRTAKQPVLELTAKEILHHVSASNEYAVYSSISILEKAGYVQRLHGYESPATVELLPAAFGWKPGRGAPLQEQLLDALVMLSEGEACTLKITLSLLGRECGLEMDQVRRGLAALEEQGVLTYEAPFRGRGIRILDRDGLPQLSRVDFAELERRRQFEYKKLAQIIDYASPFKHHCLRSYLLRYFGEWDQPRRCGHCSRCHPKPEERKAGRLEPRKAERLEERKDERLEGWKDGRVEPDAIVALKILSCIYRCGGRVGRQKLAQILRGSKSQDVLAFRSLPTWGKLSYLSEEKLLACLDRLLELRLAQSSQGRYPTIRISSAGAKFLKEKPDFSFARGLPASPQDGSSARS